MAGTFTSARMGRSDVETVAEERLMRSRVVEALAVPEPWLRSVTETVALSRLGVQWSG